MRWYHLPIRDVSIPDDAFEQVWHQAGSELQQILQAQKRIVVHCRGGLGRTGIISARLLIELGEQPERALQQVRTARPGTVQTPQQEDYVLHCLTTPRV